jgi:predicted ABC-type ATPase
VRAEDLLASLNQGAPPEKALTDNLAHRSPGVQAVEKEYPPANHEGNDTLERHRMPDGSFTPQRKALHDKIINSIIGKIPPSQDRTFYMMGGGPASGKSSVINSGQVTLPQAAHIDADAIKTQLPEYNALQGAKDMRAASFVHEESSGLGKTAMSQAFGAGQNVLLDGTGNASLDGVKSKANAARQAGYKVHAEYVTCSVDEAVRRNIERAKKTGRLPPEAFLRHTHKTVSQILPQAIAEGVFDHVRLWDTEHPGPDGKPTLVATGAGSQLTVHNQQLWDSFVAKGK